MDCERCPPQALNPNQGRQLWRNTFSRELGPVHERLAESHSDAGREVLLRLLADEEAKEPPPKMGHLKQR
jgi:hypothetical protein